MSTLTYYYACVIEVVVRVVNWCVDDER